MSARKLGEILTQIKNRIASETTLTSDCVFISLDTNPGLSPGTSYAVVTPLDFNYSLNSSEAKTGLVLEGQVAITVWHYAGLDLGKEDTYFFTDSTASIDTLNVDILDALHQWFPVDGSNDKYFIEPLKFASIGSWETEPDKHYWGKCVIVFDVLYNQVFS